MTITPDGKLQTAIVVNMNAKAPETRYLVYKKMKWDGKPYHPGETVQMPAAYAEVFFRCGVIADDIKLSGGKLVHPLDPRY